MVSVGSETETIVVLFFSVLPHTVQYDFTVQSIYSNNNDVSHFMLKGLSQLQCTRSYKSTIYHVVTYKILLRFSQSRCVCI